eukprot:2960464-Rhodomonas_salina.1
MTDDRWNPRSFPVRLRDLNPRVGSETLSETHHHAHDQLRCRTAPECVVFLLSLYFTARFPSPNAHPLTSSSHANHHILARSFPLRTLSITTFSRSHHHIRAQADKYTWKPLGPPATNVLDGLSADEHKWKGYTPEKSPMDELPDHKYSWKGPGLFFLCFCRARTVCEDRVWWCSRWCWCWERRVRSMGSVVVSIGK